MGSQADLDVQGFPQDRGAQSSCWSEAEQVAKAFPCPDLGLSAATLLFSTIFFSFFTEYPITKQYNGNKKPCILSIQHIPFLILPLSSHFLFFYHLHICPVQPL
jgi:hypothetical protein